MPTTEADQVHEGIIEMVKRHGIRKLVMGTKLESYMKVKKRAPSNQIMQPNVHPDSMKSRLSTEESMSEGPRFHKMEVSTPAIFRSRSLQNRKVVYYSAQKIFIPDLQEL